MFCKYCGKEIADDSRFCKFCGKSVFEDSSKTIDDNIHEEKSEIANEQKVESTESEPSAETVSVKVDDPVQVQLINGENSYNKATVANEIVANIKMIGLSLLLWGCYIIGFTIYHADDKKPLDDTGYWGESCYDPSYTSGDYRLFNWENHYFRLICQERDYRKKMPKSKWPIIPPSEPISQFDMMASWEMKPDEALNAAERKAKEKRIPEDVLKDLKTQAEKNAIDDRNSFNEEISDIRKYSFEEDLHNHMKWAAIICLCLTILGRYLIKSIKWISENKTE